MQIPSDVYAGIRGLVPIACVDLLITNCAGEILLVRRLNDPAKGEWWLPGGRVYLGELREVAARRKLWEECGLETEILTELRTFDVILEVPSKKELNHAISTVFAAKLQNRSVVRLDHQSQEHSWKLPSQWKKESLHPFVIDCLALL